MSAVLARQGRVMPDGRPIIWDPNPKQKVFLAANDDDVLFGGAAGGGKTDAMLIDALGLAYKAVQNKNHRAVIFRRTYPDLKDLISRSKELYPAIVKGAVYNKTEHVWTFPSGAMIEFAHLQHDDLRFNYRGRAWNWVGFEELTLWPNELCWDYISSRCRSVDPSLPCYLRATTNPDGPGQQWVMQRWAINEVGDASSQTIDVEDEREKPDGTFEIYTRKIRRRFIPARLTDNAHLRGTGYRARLNLLPPDDRDALLHGLWRGNRVRGAYYMNEMAAVRKGNRIVTDMKLARAVPINTFWDLGWNDTTAIIFHQYAAMEHRFPLSYENSGETLAHYIEYLRKQMIERNWTYGVHYLPHDAANKSLQTGESALEQLQKLWPGQKFEIVPRVERVIDGINSTRTKFPHCWFDRAGCADLIAALDNYRKKWNAKSSVYLDVAEHDRYSNYADAFRQFGQGFRTQVTQFVARAVERGRRGPA